MTTGLRDRLDALVDDVSTDPDPAALWAAGSRRRARGRLAVALSTAAALVVLLLAVIPLVPSGVHRTSPATSPTTSLTYPQRISHQAWVPDLPQAPGPLAAIIEVHRASAEGSYIDGLTPSGWRYRLPNGVAPALSDDGRHLAYATTDGTLHLRDLVTGADVDSGLSTVVRDGDAAGTGVWPTRSPMYWSPDGTRLVLQRLSPVVIGADGRSREVPRAAPAGSSHRVIGWFDDRTLAVVSSSDSLTTLARVDVDSGRAASTVRLPDTTQQSDDSGSASTSDLSTWSLSPDRTLVSRRMDLPTAGSGNVASSVEVRSATSGAVVERLTTGFDSSSGPTTWVGRTPALWTSTGLRLAVPFSTGPGDLQRWGSEPTTVVSDLRVASLTLAGDARTPTWHLLGTRTEWPGWWWLECLLGASALVGLRALYERATRPRAAARPGPSLRENAGQRRKR